MKKQMQYTFYKRQDWTNDFDTTAVRIDCEGNSIQELLEAFNDFMIACGYPKDLEIVVEYKEKGDL